MSLPAHSGLLRAEGSGNPISTKEASREGKNYRDCSQL